MKKTILAMVMAGGCLTVFAQTTPPRTTPSQSTTNNSVTNSTTDPMNSVTNTQVNSASNNSITPSTSWTPVGSPNWGWNNYGIWNQRTSINTTPGTTAYPSTYRTDASTYNSTSIPAGTTNMGTITTGTSNTYNNAASPSGTMTSGDGLNSTGTYDAYGTSTENYSKPIPSAPMNVQMNFSKEYPTTTGQTYSWNQYGDWYETQYIDKGRLTQYYYDQKGAGYSLSLPVLQTYVPEEIVDKALQKYGSSLYSIGMIKAADGTPAYSIGLLQRGQVQMVHLQESGASVANVWRVEEMTTTDANAAMDTPTDAATDTTIADDSQMKKEKGEETKTKWKENGVKTKIKSGDGKVKIKQKKVDD